MKNIIKCRICEKDITTKELSFAKNDGEKNALTKNICLKCYRKYDASFDKQLYNKRICVLYCKECNNIILSGSGIFTCECGYSPIKFKHKCPKCNFSETTKGSNWTCSKCGWSNYVKGFKHHICKNCNYEEDSYVPINNWDCPKCGWTTRNFNRQNQIFNHTCPECGNKQQTSGSNWTCNKCGFTNHNTKFQHICECCGYEEINKQPKSTWVCPKCKSGGIIHKHLCDKCGFKEENKIPINTWTCPECGNHPYKFKHECPECGFKEKTNSPSWHCKKCGWSPDVKIYSNKKCTNCGNIEENVPNIWACSVCGYSNKAIFLHKCGECGYKEKTSCPLNMWYCKKCGWEPEQAIYNTVRGYKIYYCNECGQETPHDFNKNCLVCSGERIWCERCQQWETKEVNENIYHWTHWSCIYRKLIHDGIEEPKLLAEKLNLVERFNNYNVGSDSGLHSNSGFIYSIISDGVCYVGQTTSLINRFLAHLCNIYLSPNYWRKDANNYDIVEDILNRKHNLDFKVLEECDKELLNEREIYWINKLQPWSQKCNGTDSIKPLEERNIILKGENK